MHGACSAACESWGRAPRVYAIRRNLRWVDRACAVHPATAIRRSTYRGDAVSKGLDSKKGEKKKPAKTMKEKKAVKDEKKRNQK
ncbi:hypothetical protein ACVKN3_001233 [Luteibacter sp. PvP120]